ncbi:MAG TPA: hypothetical protein VKA76_15975 [Gammaproteobacteria bacterium]|nr:hypothetical protein [Gammaproteobacteria bacterium]
MSASVDFAYAQARLQARHGRRPSEADWRRLDAIRDPSHYLQTARTTALRPWVLGLGPQVPVHEMAAQLRRHFRGYVEETARWQPAPWRPAVVWVAELPMLPLLRELLTADRLPAWIRADPRLQEVVQDSREARRAALERTRWSPLLTAWTQDRPLRAGWLTHWRTLWPAETGIHRDALAQLQHRVQAHIDWMASASADKGVAAREALARVLLRLFRRYDRQPAATFAHLGLIALDLERLRGEVAERLLFKGAEAA